MSELTLDTAIKHCLDVAEQNETQAQKIGRQLMGSAIDKYATDCRECAADHRQLAEWLMELKDLRAEQNDQYVFIHELMNELKEAKRLLKVAVVDFDSVVRRLEGNDILCMKYIACKGCPFDSENCNKWRGTDEALKLLNDEK